MRDLAGLVVSYATKPFFDRNEASSSAFLIILLFSYHITIGNRVLTNDYYYLGCKNLIWHYNCIKIFITKIKFGI